VNRGEAAADRPPSARSLRPAGLGVPPGALPRSRRNSPPGRARDQGQAVQSLPHDVPVALRALHPSRMGPKSDALSGGRASSALDASRFRRPITHRVSVQASPNSLHRGRAARGRSTSRHGRSDHAVL
jgi:hypothetical protein